MSAPGPSETRSLVLSPAQTAPSGRDPVLGRLEAGEMFVELCDDDANGRAAALDALLCALGPDTTLRWISNPLRSPLTLERLFLQAVGPDADLRVERSPSELAGMLEQAAGEARRFLLIVQQPETLDAEARDTLARLAPYLAEGPALVQFLFCCTSAFRPIIPVSVGRTLPVLSLRADELAEPRRSPWRTVLSVLLLLLLAGMGGALFLKGRALLGGSAKPIETSSLNAAEGATMRAPTPSVPATPAPAPAAALATPSSGTPASDLPTLGAPALDGPAAPDLSEASPRIDVAVARREFDHFLAQQPPRIANLNEQQRDALFEEFLRHYRGGDKGAP